jgi:glycosyltransferase involved in cell wall biosynthesis
MNARVSILIAAYNAEKYISQTIESVLSQTCADWELIVCDDGSSDATGSIVQSYAQCDSRIKLTHQTNAGGAAARNTAYALSSGDYIVLLDADDMILPDKLQLQVSLLDRHPEAGLVYGDTWFCDQDGKRIQLESERYPGQHQQGDLFALICCGNMMAVHSAMVRRSVIEAVGGIHHPTKMQIADWDLWVRIAERFSFVYHPEPVADYRLHPMMSARQDDALKQVLQREFNVSRMEQLVRFSTLGRKDKARIYFAHGRFCAQWKVVPYAFKYYVRSFKYNPFYLKTYLAVLALLVRK